MPVLREFTQGERIRYYRERRGLSQKTLGELVGRSENWVFKVEKDQIPVDRVSVLFELARVLNVQDLSDLTGGSFKSATAGPSREHTAVPAIRRSLFLPSSRLGTDEGDPPTVSELEEAIGGAWAVYENPVDRHETRYETVGAQLPDLLGQAHRALRAASGGQEELAVVRQIISLYGLHQIWLRRVGEPTLSRIAADRGLVLADSTGDPALRAAAAWNLACVFTSTGDAADSVELARDTIATCAPDDESSAEHLSAYGALHLQAAVAAVRSKQEPVAWDLFRTAERIAGRIGEDRNDFHTAFGPTNVAMHQVHLAAEEGDAGEALRRADSVEVSSDTPLERRTRYLIEVMNCNRIQRDDYATVFMLRRIMDQAPEEARFSVLVREAVADLMKREKPTWREDLRAVAKGLRMAA